MWAIALQTKELLEVHSNFLTVWWKINVNEEKSKYVEFSAHLALKFIAKRILLHQNTRNTTRIYIKYM